MSFKHLTHEICDHTSTITGHTFGVNVDPVRFWVPANPNEAAVAAMRQDLGRTVEAHLEAARVWHTEWRAERRVAERAERAAMEASGARVRKRRGVEKPMGRTLVPPDGAYAKITGYRDGVRECIQSLARATPADYHLRVEELLAWTFAYQTSGKKKTGVPSRIGEALTLCWRHGLLVYPGTFAWFEGLGGRLPMDCFANQDERFYGPASAFLKFCADATKEGASFAARCYLTTAGVQVPGDLDTPYFARLAPLLFANADPTSPAENTRKYANSRLSRFASFQRKWHDAETPILSKIPMSHKAAVAPARNLAKRSSPRFEWALQEGGERLRTWVDVATQHVATLVNRVSIKETVNQVNQILEWVIQQQDVPSDPVQACRVDTALTKPYPKWLGEQKEGTQTALARHLRGAKAFFDWLLEEKASNGLGVLPGYRNMVAGHDVVSEPRRNGVTLREPIPYRYLRMLREILEEPGPSDINDPQSAPAPYYWPRTVSADYFDWLNPQTGRFERVWNPVRCYFMLLRLMLPIRELQVRLLDSGEGDPEVYRPERGGWVRNDGPHAPAARIAREPQGFVRRIWDEERGAFFEGLYITTNKTADRASGFTDTGYQIPWGGYNNEIVDLFTRLRDWQEKHHAVPGSLSRAQLSDDNLQVASETAARLTKHFFLFRDPCLRSNSASTAEPITRGRLALFWRLLLDELERRLWENGERNDDGSKIVLVERRHEQFGYPEVVRWDPHTLRVSGLTNLQRAGVPLHVLAEFVAGHATVLMTLYYVRRSNGEIVSALNEATERIRDGETRDYSAWLSSVPPEVAKEFTAWNDPVAVEQAKSTQSAMYATLDEGICPNGGTMCDVGGPELVMATRAYRGGSAVPVHGPVPGGARTCPNCRFFLTGPAWLPGLAARFNETSGLLREAIHAQEQAEAHRGRLAAEASAGDTLNDPLVKREMLRADEAVQQAVSRVEHLNTLWTSRLRLIRRVEQIMEERRKSGESPSKDLVLNGEATDLKLALTECTEYELFTNICETYRLHPSVDPRPFALRRAMLFNAMIGRNGGSPPFWGLTDQQLLDAGNAVAEFLRLKLGAQGAADVVAGRQPLEDSGVLAEIERMAKQAARLSALPMVTITERREVRALPPLTS